MDQHYLGYVSEFLDSKSRFKCLHVCREWRYAPCLSQEYAFLSYRRVSQDTFRVAQRIHAHQRMTTTVHFIEHPELCQIVIGTTCSECLWAIAQGLPICKCRYYEHTSLSDPLWIQGETRTLCLRCVCLFHVFTNYSPNNLSRAHDLTDPAAQFAGFLGASSCSDMCDYKYLYGKCKKYINEDVLKMFAMRAAVHCLEWSQLVEFGMGINADLHNEVVGIENTSKWLPEAANEPFSVMVLCGALAAHHQSMVDQLIADHLVSNLDLEDVLAKDIVILKDTVYRVASDIRKQSFDLYRRRCREDQHCPNVERCEEFIQLLMDQTEGFTFYMGQSMLTILMRIMTENPNSSLRDYYDHLLADGWDMTHVDHELVLTIWKQMGWS